MKLDGVEPAALLRNARHKAGLTQAGLARRLGRSQATIASLERPGANPTLATLDDALRATGNRLELRVRPFTANVDDTLIARNLRLPPAERLAAFENAHREIEKLRDARKSG
jgi:transcriptional regulator with XRE-family HTH domain